MTHNIRFAYLLFLLAGLVMIGSANVFPSESFQQEIQIQWQPPQQYPVNEDEYLEVLSFHGAVYGERMAAIPKYSWRTESGVPHFSHDIILEDKVYKPLTAKEEALIREADFFQDSIIPQVVRGSSRGKVYDIVQFYPFRYLEEEDRFEKLVSFTLNTALTYDPELTHHIPDDRYAESSVLAEGSWYKLCVEETGIYRLGYDELSELGISPASVQKQNIRLFGNGSGMLPEANDAPFDDDLKENAIMYQVHKPVLLAQMTIYCFMAVRRIPGTWIP